MSSIAKKDALQIIDEMSRDEFYKECVTGVMALGEVSKMMTSDVSFLTPPELERIKESIISVGLATKEELSPEKVKKIIRHMSARAFARR